MKKKPMRRRLRKAPPDMVDGAIFDSNNYGKVKVVEYVRNDYVEIEFLSTGTRLITESRAIRKGSVRDRMAPTFQGVGFIGVGEFNSWTDDRAFSVWHGMIKRCYNKSHQAKVCPTYSGCVVCDEWHNFQNFAKWYYDNYPKGDGNYQLDKDLSSYGATGKLYSPETCAFVLSELNQEEAHAHHWRIRNPDGVIVDIYNLRKFCRENNLDASGMWLVATGRGRLRSYKGWTRVLS